MMLPRTASLVVIAASALCVGANAWVFEAAAQPTFSQRRDAGIVPTSASPSSTSDPRAATPRRPALGYGVDAWRSVIGEAARGATLGPIESSLHPGVGYGTDASGSALDELVAHGCNWVSITPFGRIWDLRSTEIQLDFEMPYEQNRVAIERVVQQAHARGLRVLLIPHLWVETGGWRGEIDPGTEQRWAQWFASYRRFVLEWARTAQRARADMFSVGVEMKSSSATRGPDWFDLIDAVRNVYDGLLTYSANWDEESRVVFWDRLDVVGINAFYPLTERTAASLADLRRGALSRMRSLREWAHRVGRVVMFTEYGYTARADPALRPWEWPDEMHGVRVDEHAQAIATRALLEAFAGEPWFAGAFVWRYYSNPMDASQEAPWGFSPRLREAESVLREIHALQWGADRVDRRPAWLRWDTVLSGI